LPPIRQYLERLIAPVSNERLHGSNSAIEIVVDDANRPESASLSQFGLGNSDSALGLFGGIASSSKPFCLNFCRGGLKQHEETPGNPIKHLGGTLNIDFEDDVSFLDPLRPWGAVQIPEEFRIFEKSTRGSMIFELRSSHPDIGVLTFTRATLARAP